SFGAIRTDEGGNFNPVDRAQGREPAVPGDKLILLALLAHDHRLEQTVFADRGSQFVDVVETAAWVTRTELDVVQPDVPYAGMFGSADGLRFVGGLDRLRSGAPWHCSPP